MKRSIDISKYFQISSISAIMFIIALIFDDIMTGAIFSNDALYFVKVLIAIALTTLLFTPIIGFLDFLLVKMLGQVFIEFKNSDRMSKLIFVLAFVFVLLRKMLIWIMY